MTLEAALYETTTALKTLIGLLSRSEAPAAFTPPNTVVPPRPLRRKPGCLKPRRRRFTA